MTMLLLEEKGRVILPRSNKLKLEGRRLEGVTKKAQE
jgi:hypothetical protein